MSAEDNRRLYGTEQTPEPSRRLTAGPLAVDLEAGDLRDIRFGGVEVLRAISFLVRSPRWATYEKEITGLTLSETPDAFEVAYRATVRDGDARLDYAARIEGRANGSLVFRCDINPVTDFVTCRAGFVVLHPAAVAGGVVRVEHSDGGFEDTRFPTRIDPVQPMLDLRALTHEAAPGLMATCRMEGDVFEMEDQRNWTDASFKTYVRPLSRPWPYNLPAGSHATQSVSLSVQGTPLAERGEGAPIGVELGAPVGAMPEIGVGCTPDEARAALPHAARLARAGIATLVCRFDPGQGHAGGDFAAFRALAQAIGAEVEVQIVLHSIDAFAAELRRVAEEMSAAGLVPRRVAVSPAPDLKSTTPGQPWPACAPLDRVYQAARAVFPGVSLAGGTFAYFTELNRKRPPLDLLDAVTFSTSPLVHAADDRSVMQSLEALPAVAASARAIAGDRPLLIGPSAIGCRDNPYGPGPLANPGGVRLAMSGADPRQRGLFNAAWTFGYIAAFATADANIARIAVSAPVGDHGILDEAGLFPVFEVIRGMASLRGAVLHDMRVGQPDRLAGLLAVLPDRCELWIANLTAHPQIAAISDPVRALLARHPDAPRDAVAGTVRCDAYAVLHWASGHQA